MKSSNTKPSKFFYITTTLPYVNAEPHLGHAVEFVRADIIARYKKLQGFDVFFNTGTDEHGQKLAEEAKKADKPVQEYVDEQSKRFIALQGSLGLLDDIHFIRTTDPKHVRAAQAFWKRCFDRGFIYKKNYQAKYCVGCELEKQDSELVNGRCPIHPNREIEIINEENYFFKFSAFEQRLLDLYARRPDFVVPDFRFNEIKKFVEGGLKDFSISRLARKMSWGIAVPGDPEHVMYVWFDALVSYISSLGWPESDAKSENDEKNSTNKGGNFSNFWKNGTPVQYCGKDNLRQQSAMWQAMLLAADLPNSHQIVIDGFITGEGGIKMSKSIGNVVDPLSIIKEYGVDVLRYYVAREVSAFEDSPFTPEAFKAAYNANLANGLGNLVSRVVKMAETNGVSLGEPFVSSVTTNIRSVTDSENSENAKISEHMSAQAAQLSFLYAEYYDRFEINKVCDEIWKKITAADKFIQANEPFKKVKIDQAAGKADISYLLGEVAAVALMLVPIMPETSIKIITALRDNKISSPLFLRK